MSFIPDPPKGGFDYYTGRVPDVIYGTAAGLAVAFIVAALLLRMAGVV